jgi:hypothetical protein
LLDDLFVNIFAVTNLEDGDLLSPIIDQVDNAVVTLSDAIAVIVPSELLCSMRSRIKGQGLNSQY